MTAVPRANDGALVLVIDDDRDTCLNLADILTDRGYRVQTCSDGYEALAFAEREPVDIALIDLRMPTLDGISVCRGLKERRPNLRAIVITAFATDDNLRMAQAVGAEVILPKPVNMDVLLPLMRGSLPPTRILLVCANDEVATKLVPMFSGEPVSINWVPSLEESELVLDAHDCNLVVVAHPGPPLPEDRQRLAAISAHRPVVELSPQAAQSARDLLAELNAALVAKRVLARADREAARKQEH